MTTDELKALGYEIIDGKAVRVAKKGNKVTEKPLISKSDIFFNIHPLPKIRMVKSDAWKKRPAVLKYWKYKEELLRQATAVNFTLPDTFEASFIIPMPPTWSKKKMATMDGKPHQQRPDVDNLVKALMDCLKKEDSSVYKILISKYWGKDGKIIVGNMVG